MQKNKDVTIIPFYSECKNKEIKGTNYVNLQGEKAIIRGIECVKTAFTIENMYCNGEKIIGKVYYWKPCNSKNRSFENGLEMLGLLPKKSKPVNKSGKHKQGLERFMKKLKKE